MYEGVETKIEAKPVTMLLKVPQEIYLKMFDDRRKKGLKSGQYVIRAIERELKNKK